MKRIKIQRLRPYNSSNPVHKVFESEPGGGSRRKGWPRERRAEQVTKNVTTLAIRKW